MAWPKAILHCPGAGRYNADMADPVEGSLLAMLRRDQVHSQDIASTLEFLREALGREGIPFALIGALALRYHRYERFTEDIDILTTPEGLERMHEKLVGHGIVPRASGLRKKLRQTQFKVNIDVVAAGEHAGSGESPVTFPSPESDAFIEHDGIRVATIELLIALKIASGVWGRRRRDLGDVQELIRANGLGEDLAEKIPEPLRPTFLEILEDARNQSDIED